MHSYRTPALGLGAALAWLALGGTGWAQYACGTLSSGHCYAVTTWMEHPEYFGAYTDIPQMLMSCVGCDGFVTNEIWMVDDTTPECAANPFHHCWVEAGYLAHTGQQMPFFFWADVAPGGQFRLAFPGWAGQHTLNHFMLVKDGRTTPASFLLFIYNTSLSTLFSAVSVTSTGNPMKANRIVMGQELAGTTNATAPTTSFTRNIRAVVPLGPEYVFWYEPQWTRGWERQDAPPWERWRVLPSLPGGPEGGDFTTRCCR